MPSIRIRTCKTCGDKKTVHYLPTKDTECRPCMKLSQSAKMIGKNTKPLDKQKRYWHFCPSCPSIRVGHIKMKSHYCSPCKNKLPRKNKPRPIYFDMESMMYKLPIRYFRICKHCGDEKQVKQASLGGIKSCVKCRHIDMDSKEADKKRKATMKKNGTASGRKKGKTTIPRARARAKSNILSPEAIEAIREINAKHREAEKIRIANQKHIPVARSDEDMVAEYLLTSAIKDVSREPIDDSREVKIKGY